MTKKDRPNEERESRHVHIQNWTGSNVIIDRVGPDDPVMPPYPMPGWSDDFHLKWDSQYKCFTVRLKSPTGCPEMCGENNERYIVFKDQNGRFRFAYIGTDGYVNRTLGEDEILGNDVQLPKNAKAVKSE